MPWVVLELLYLLAAVQLGGAIGPAGRLSRTLWPLPVLVGYLGLLWASSYYSLSALAPPSRRHRARRATQSVRLKAGGLLLMSMLTLMFFQPAGRGIVELWIVLVVLCAVLMMMLRRRSDMSDLLAAPVFPLEQPYWGQLQPMLWAAGLPQADLLRLGDEPSCSAAAAFYIYWRKKHRILLTTPLLSMMNRDELRGVFAHELGHAKGDHGRGLTRLRVGCMLVAAGAATGTTGLLFLDKPLLFWFLAAALVYRIVMVVAGIPYAAVSRRSELQAHREAMEITQDPSAYRGGIQKLSDSHWDMPSRGGWLMRLWLIAPGPLEVLALIDEWERQHPHARPVVFTMPTPPPLPPGAWAPPAGFAGHGGRRADAPGGPPAA